MTKLILILGVACSSLSAIFPKFAQASPLVLAFYRMFFAALLTMVLVLARQREELRHISRKDLLMCSLSGIALGFHFACYLTSLTRTGIASSVTLADTEVFFVAIAGTIFLREKLSVKAWVGICVTFAGSVIIAMGDAGGGRLSGDLLALTAAACSCAYTMIGRKCRDHLSTGVYTMIVYFFAAAVNLVLCTFSTNYITSAVKVDLLSALGMAVFCTLLGHSLYSWGLRYEKASFVSVVKLLEPVFAAILGFLLFTEIPPVTSIIGAVIIIAGITGVIKAQ